ncbi:vascular-related unknown protein 1-like [Magnolia sinica]|uniref:vascular-related unknown protein 1-like n=1 Tax=Magnolia sinica TaxID=86752 RepID=UPI00265A8F0C|nr:vascular-related unknown protein 1-like [Magnolia sinica]
MEESSIYSSTNKPLSSSSSYEESGWTTYLDDLLPEGDKETCVCSNGYRISSSLISDAASCAAWKLDDRAECSAQASERFKKLNFKKRRTRVLDDDSLEDTASSPVNSPKVSELQQKGMKPNKKEADGSSFQEKEVGSSNWRDVPAVERNELDFIENDYSELKKKGLCLVPLSMLVNLL